MIINGLLADVYTFLTQNACYLPWRPVLLNHAIDAPPQFVRLTVVALEAVFAAVTLGLRLFPHITVIRLRVTLGFTADRRFCTCLFLISLDTFLFYNLS